jgi:hypothetical protein
MGRNLQTTYPVKQRELFFQNYVSGDVATTTNLGGCSTIANRYDAIDATRDLGVMCDDDDGHAALLIKIA